MSSYHYTTLNCPRKPKAAPIAAAPPETSPHLASLRRELWRMDWWLEDRFDSIVKYGQGPDTSAKLAELYEHALQRSHGE